MTQTKPPYSADPYFRKSADGKRWGFPLTRAQFSKECESCGASMDFVKTEAGRWCPLDPAHTFDVGGVTIAEAHFAVCPNAGDFRRKKGTR